jgi:peroxiredoxin
MAVHVGQKAPDFRLPDTNKKYRTLADFAGKKTVLAFFPGAFTGTCTKEMCALRDSMATMNTIHAQIVGISVDAPAANGAFAKELGLQFPLLSDWNRETIKAYDIVHVGLGGVEGYTSAMRSVFILNGSGVVQYKWVAEQQGNEPNYDEVTTALGSFS